MCTCIKEQTQENKCQKQWCEFLAFPFFKYMSIFYQEKTYI